MALRTRNILSLCAGVGGLELGILLALHSRSEAGRGICYVEREAAAAASLVASMEGGWFHPAPVWSDMLTFDARPWRGLVHILASGDPCQDNSVAGKRAGAEGDRFLAPEVVRVAAECRPDLIFRENVPGNLAEQLAALAPPLEGLGYRVAAGIFSSAETGNTMRRERLFIMAVREGGIWGVGARPPRECLSDAGRGRRELALSDGWRGGDGHLQCGGELGLLTQGNGVGGGVAELGDAALRRRDEFTTGRRQRISGASGGSGSELGRPICGCDERLTHDAQRGSVGRTAVDRAGCEAGRKDGGSGMACACACGPRPQGGELCNPSGSQFRVHAPRSTAKFRGALLPPAVIPGPTDSRWIDVLDRFPELQPAISEEEAQSHLRRGIDAMAHRIERLRATGNGVDPVVAATAFLSLGALLDA